MKRILIVDMKSYLDPDDKNQDELKSSMSTEASYIAEHEDTDELHEGCIKIESMALMGILKAEEMVHCAKKTDSA